MQFNAHKTGRERRLPVLTHKKRGRFDAHVIFAQVLIILQLSKKGRCRLIQETDAMSSIFDWAYEFEFVYLKSYAFFQGQMILK